MDILAVDSRIRGQLPLVFLFPEHLCGRTSNAGGGTSEKWGAVWQMAFILSTYAPTLAHNTRDKIGTNLIELELS